MTDEAERQARDHLGFSGKKAERFVREAAALRANLALRRKQKGHACRHSK